MGLVLTPVVAQATKSASGAKAATAMDAKTAQDMDPKAVRKEVQKAFGEWRDAYAEGDTEQFLQGFAQIPDLTIRITGNEWIGYQAYADALLQVELPKTSYPFRSVRIVPIDEFAAYVTYIRDSAGKDERGRPLAFRGTVIYAKTFSGWKVIAWHTHALVEPVRKEPEFKQ